MDTLSFPTVVRVSTSICFPVVGGVPMIRIFLSLKAGAKDHFNHRKATFHDHKKFVHMKNTEVRSKWWCGIVDQWYCQSGCHWELLLQKWPHASDWISKCCWKTCQSQNRPLLCSMMQVGNSDGGHPWFGTFFWAGGVSSNVPQIPEKIVVSTEGFFSVPQIWDSHFFGCDFSWMDLRAPKKCQARRNPNGW